MKEILSDLWNGRVFPKKESSLTEDEERLVNARLESLRLCFAKNMDNEEIKAFLEYEAVNRDLLEREKENAFTQGFSLAVRLFSEALLPKS